MTENRSHTTLPGKQRPGTVGLPRDGAHSRTNPVSGEIQMQAPCLTLGCSKDPELTRQALTEDGWLRTGDKCALDAVGNLRIIGRVKDLFNTGKGPCVAPAPIEGKRVMPGAGKACCVTGAKLGQPLALLMLNLEATATPADPAAKAALEVPLAEPLKRVNVDLDPREKLDALVFKREAWTADNDLITPTFKGKRNRAEDLFTAHYERWVAARKPVPGV